MDDRRGGSGRTHSVRGVSLNELDRVRRGLVVQVVSDVLAMVPDLPGDRPSAAAAAAHLLLEHTCPWLDVTAREQLARTCERAAQRFEG